MTLLRFILGMLLGFLDRVVGALVLCKVWAWWVVPFWPSAPSLTFLRALGIGLIISTVWVNSSVWQVRAVKKLEEDEENEWNDAAWAVASICIVWPFTLGVAWLFRWVLL